MWLFDRVYVVACYPSDGPARCVLDYKMRHQHACRDNIIIQMFVIAVPPLCRSSQKIYRKKNYLKQTTKKEMAKRPIAGYARK